MDQRSGVGRDRKFARGDWILFRLPSSRLEFVGGTISGFGEYARLGPGFWQDLAIWSARTVGPDGAAAPHSKATHVGGRGPLPIADSGGRRRHLVRKIINYTFDAYVVTRFARAVRRMFHAT